MSIILFWLMVLGRDKWLHPTDNPNVRTFHPFITSFFQLNSSPFLFSYYWYAPKIISNWYEQNVYIYRCPMNALFTNFPATFKLMMTSSNGSIFRVTGPLCGEITGPGEFPVERPVTRSFDVFFHLRLNKRLSKQPWGWWFETPGWSLWRHLMREHLWTQFSFPVEMRSRMFSNSFAKTAFY